MSSTKLFIGDLSYKNDDKSLWDAFTNFRDMIEAKVITDRDTGRSTGLELVKFASDELASNALSGMDGQELHGWNIRVSYSNDKPTGGHGGYGGGGYIGRGYGGGDKEAGDFRGDSGRGS